MEKWELTYENCEEVLNKLTEEEQDKIIEAFKEYKRAISRICINRKEFINPFELELAFTTRALAIDAKTYDDIQNKSPEEMLAEMLVDLLEKHKEKEAE